MITFKNNLERFIEEGGGYIGHCGGGTFPVKFAFDPRTFSERWDDENSFITSDVKNYFHMGLPNVAEHGYLDRWWPPWHWFFYTPHPEYIGTSGYYYYDMRRPSGAPMHVEVRDKEHPIVCDYLGDTFLVRWGGGPAYSIPYNPDISGVVYYPMDDCLT